MRQMKVGIMRTIKQYMMHKRVYVCLLVILFSFPLAAKEFNVKDFGAKGDGRSDDTKSVELALNEVGRLGGTLYFPNGIYLIRPVVIQSNDLAITIKGESRAAIIKKITDANANLPGIITYRGKGKFTKSNLTITDLSIDGNADQSKSYWIRKGNKIYVDKMCNGINAHYVVNIEVNNCSITNIHGSGISVYSSAKLACKGNDIKNVRESGIRGEEIDSIICRNNNIQDVGICPPNYILDGKLLNRKMLFLPTMFGDGISGYCNILIAEHNYIKNAGRCAIVHDLAIDLKYPRSKAIVNENSIVINSSALNNDNPPAAMWFEQTAKAIVNKNSVKVENSYTWIYAGIRFYNITDAIECNNNIIDASNYTNSCNTGIFVENSNVNKIDIRNNVITGKVLEAIYLSYDKGDAGIKDLNIVGNKISGRGTLKNGICLLVGGLRAFPSNVNINNNIIESASLNSIQIKRTGKVQENAKCSFDLTNNRIRSSITKSINVDIPRNIKVKM